MRAYSHHIVIIWIIIWLKQNILYNIKYVIRFSLYVESDSYLIINILLSIVFRKPPRYNEFLNALRDSW